MTLRPLRDLAPLAATTALAAVAALTIVTTNQEPAVAADHTATYDQTRGPFNTYDGEEIRGTYAIAYLRIYSRDLSGGRDRVTGGRVRIYPDKRLNGSLRCSNIARAFIFNPGPIAGYNPPAIRIPCSSSGGYRNFGIPDRVLPRGGGDRTITGTVRIDRPVFTDPWFRFPTRRVR